MVEQRIRWPSDAYIRAESRRLLGDRLRRSSAGCGKGLQQTDRNLVVLVSGEAESTPSASLDRGAYHICLASSYFCRCQISTSNPAPRDFLCDSFHARPISLGMLRLQECHSVQGSFAISSETSQQVDIEPMSK